MKKILLMVVFTLIATSASSAETFSKLDDKGNIQIGDDAENLTLRDENVHVQAQVRGREAFGKYSIFAIPSITNLSGRRFYISYNFSFYSDEDDLLVTVSQGFDIDKDASGFQLGSAFTSTPREIAEQVRSYKIVVYCIFDD